jgi:hypothetical protein
MYETEYRLRRHDGECRHMAVRGVPVLEPGGFAAVLDAVLEHSQSQEGIFGYIDEEGAPVFPTWAWEDSSVLTAKVPVPSGGSLRFPSFSKMNLSDSLPLPTNHELRREGSEHPGAHRSGYSAGFQSQVAAGCPGAGTQTRRAGSARD